MKFLTALSISIMPFFGMAQSISPEVIASAGEHFDNGTVQLSWTMGEVMIDTYDNGSNILTQGFHQTELTVTAIDENLSDVRVVMYPNPTSEYLNIDLGNNEKNIGLKIFDMNGKLIHHDVIKAFQNSYRVPMDQVAAGKYLVQLLSEDGGPITTFQVAKIGVN